MDRITIDVAQEIVCRASKMAAVEFVNRPICIAVYDKEGFLISLYRMDGASIRSIEISQRKAYTAARMEINTDAVLARLRRENLELSYFGDSKYTALPGGVLLKNNCGRVMGAIGVSGLTAQEDQKISEAMAAWLAVQE